MEEADVPRWYIDSCIKVKYLFPKAHAVAYVIMSFRIAWFKIYEPLAFYGATFSVREGLDGTVITGGLGPVEALMAGLKEKISKRDANSREKGLYSSMELAREMLLRGYKFLPVDLDKSDARLYLPENEGLRLPFNALPKLGLVAAGKIVEARNEKPFQSVDDLRARAKVGNSLTELLRAQGALNNLTETNQQSMF